MPSESKPFSQNKIMWTLLVVRLISLFDDKVNTWVKGHIDALIAFESVRGVIFEWIRTKIYARPKKCST